MDILSRRLLPFLLTYCNLALHCAAVSRVYVAVSGVATVIVKWS
jgi:hypothetical protein